MTGWPATAPAAEARTRRWLRLGYALAAIVAARMGYDFGLQIGGIFMGALLGANAAVFAWLMVGAAADLVLRLLRR